jgi:hypothetical protein
VGNVLKGVHNIRVLFLPLGEILTGFGERRVIHAVVQELSQHHHH